MPATRGDRRAGPVTRLATLSAGTRNLYSQCHHPSLEAIVSSLVTNIRITTYFLLMVGFEGKVVIPNFSSRTFYVR